MVSTILTAVTGAAISAVGAVIFPLMRNKLIDDLEGEDDLTITITYGDEKLVLPMNDQERNKKILDYINSKRKHMEGQETELTISYD